jgi:hypothetical protein
MALRHAEMFLRFFKGHGNELDRKGCVTSDTAFAAWQVLSWQSSHMRLSLVRT